MKKYLVFIVGILTLMHAAAGARAEATSATNDASIQAAVEQLRQLYATEIIMGTPLEVDGQKLIPLATVGIGYGQYGMQSDGMQRQGAGGVLIPVGVIVVSGDDVRIIQISKSFVEQLVGALAPVVVQILNRRSGTGAERDEAQQEETRKPGQPSKIGSVIVSTYFRGAVLFSLVWLVLILLIHAFLPQQVSKLVSILGQNYSRSGLVGLLSYGVAFLLTAVFTISLIGIPLSFVVIVLTWAFTLFGTTSLAFIIGQRIVTVVKRPQVSKMLCTLIGGIFLGVVGMIPILGWLVWTIVVIFGFGTALQLQWENMRKVEN